MTHCKVKTLVKERVDARREVDPRTASAAHREALVASARDVFATDDFIPRRSRRSRIRLASLAGPSTRTSRTKRNSSSPFLIVTWNCKPPLSTPSSKKLAVRSPHLMRTSRVVEPARCRKRPQWLALNLEFRLYALRNPDVRDRFVARYHGYRDRIVAYLSEILRDLDRELRFQSMISSPSRTGVRVESWNSGSSIRSKHMSSDRFSRFSTTERSAEMES